MNFQGKFGQDPGQSTIVIQCKHDKQDITNRTIKGQQGDSQYFWFYKQKAGPITDEASTRIDRGDMVFTIGTSEAPRASMSKSAVPVVSTISGMYIRKAKGDDKLKLDQDNDKKHEDIINAKLARGLRFIGVSLGWTNPTPDTASQEKTQITTRVRGTGKVFNNSQITFVPGETVIWTIPNSDDITYMKKLSRYGRSTEKITPMIVPLRHFMNHNISQNMVTVMKAQDSNDFAQKVGSNSTTDFSVAMKAFLVKVFLLGVEKHADFNLLVNEPNISVNTIKNQQSTDLTKSSNAEVESARKVQSIIETIFNFNISHKDDDINKKIRNELDALLVPFLEIQDDIRRRTVGTTIGYSAPGTDCSIIIGS
jgi:hypothetical protein